jgi:uncharacterized protein YuzE
MKVWFDEEGDFLEITFANRKGTFREFGHDVYERVDARGNVIGIAVFNFRKRDRKRSKSDRWPVIRSGQDEPVRDQNEPHRRLKSCGYTDWVVLIGLMGRPQCVVCLSPALVGSTLPSMLD